MYTVCHRCSCLQLRNVTWENVDVVFAAYFSLIVAEDKRLPSVQPIRVTLPENYPENSPTCKTLTDEQQTGGYTAVYWWCGFVICDISALQFIAIFYQISAVLVKVD